MKSKQEILDLLSHATGTSTYHRFSILPGFPIATDGVIALADAAECYWMLDIIGMLQGNPLLDPKFQVWKLEVEPDTHSATLRGYNDTELIVEEHIPFTDFPLEQIKVYLINGVLLLPSEYTCDFQLFKFCFISLPLENLICKRNY